MGHSNGVITAPVNTDDVVATIGEGSHDVATLCTSDSINPDALFCPRYSSANPGLYLRGTSGGADGNSAGFQEIAGNISQRPDSSYECPRYGVWVPRYMLQNLVPSNYYTMDAMANKEWHIARPDKNGTASFKILDHFIGYDHNVRVTKPVIQSYVTSISGGYRITVNFMTPMADGKTMSVSNIFGGRGYYFGAVIFRSTNSEGITQNDKMIVMGSKTGIGTLSEVSVQISKDDTDIDSTKDYYYRIIPFVSNKSNITESTLIDAQIYGLKINKTCPKFYEKGTTASSSPTIATVQFFNWKEANNGEFYPYPGWGNPPTAAQKWPSGVNTPDILITYSEIPESRYSKLLDKYNKIEFHFTYYVSGQVNEIVYTWLKTGTDPDINAITRDTQRDNTGGFENTLFFYIPQNQFWNTIKALHNGNSDITVSDMFGRFYYVDSLGYNIIEDTFATYIPDTIVE